MMLKIDQVSIKFGGLIAVDNVSFSINEGSIFGLIGPNGAGKTTLFNLISGVYTRNEGHIVLQDQDITGLPPYKICRNGIARTYQNINLFNELTVLENVQIGCHNTINSNVFSNILRTKQQREEEKVVFEKSMDLLHFVELDNLKNYKASSLSYGDQRKLEIARALASSPKLLLLDEPAAGMNQNEKLELTKLIKKINNKNITILLVEHNMKLVMNITNEIIVLNFGKKISQGSPSNIQEDPVVIDAYLGGDLNEK